MPELSRLWRFADAHGFDWFSNTEVAHFAADRCHPSLGLDDECSSVLS